MAVATRIPAKKDTPKVRSLALVSAVGAALVTWLMVDGLAGYEIQAPGFGGVPPTDVGPGAVAFASFVAASLGLAWATILERWAARSARVAWTSTAVAFTVLSAGGPLSGSGITAGQRLILLLLHLMVAIVFIWRMWTSFEAAGGAS